MASLTCSLLSSLHEEATCLLAVRLCVTFAYSTSSQVQGKTLKNLSLLSTQSVFESMKGLKFVCSAFSVFRSNLRLIQGGGRGHEAQVDGGDEELPVGRRRRRRRWNTSSVNSTDSRLRACRNKNEGKHGLASKLEPLKRGKDNKPGRQICLFSPRDPTRVRSARATRHAELTRIRTRE